MGGDASVEERRCWMICRLGVLALWAVGCRGHRGGGTRIEEALVALVVDGDVDELAVVDGGLSWTGMAARISGTMTHERC